MSPDCLHALGLSRVPRLAVVAGTGWRSALETMEVLASIPQDDDLRKKSANYQIVGTDQSQWGALFAELGLNVGEAPPVRPAPLSQDELLELFDGSETGAGYTLVPATDMDMRGKNAAPQESLEVIYDEA